MNYLHIIYLQIKFYNIRKRRCYFMLIAKINIYRACYGFSKATRVLVYDLFCHARVYEVPTS